ncbi:MAG: molybdopterin-guanine dinucleotide biosynthesis protein MobB [Deltaproteobacteria bacterium]|jgi:molybdopterin-guanine dinucleotide biosynthesis protein B|nr:molybdopterin-guanine dinucleotide biosynthesis protein MobB [Deltaproteobacteria bacterium]
MRAAGIIGYKNAGKSALTALLAGALERRGLKVAVAKYAHSPLDKPDTDSARLRVPGRSVLALAEEECALFYGEKRFLVDMLPLIQADILLVEGGKHLGLLPRILCLRAPDEAEADEREKLDQGLAFAVWGRTGAPGLPFFPGEPGKEDEALEALATLTLEKAFLLPGLDCAACGRENCAALAAAIVAGKAGTHDCAALHSEVEAHINGQPLGLNAFASRIMAGALRGMLREMKGYAPGELTLKMRV